MLRWFWWRINAWSEIVAMLGSLVYFLLFRNVTINGRPIADEELMLAVAVATITTWLLATYVTPAENMEILSAFYRKVRPGGPGWKQVATQASDVQPDQHLALSIFAAIAASGIVYCTLPGIGYVLFGRYMLGIGCLVGATVCAGIVWLLMRMIGWKNVL